MNIIYVQCAVCTHSLRQCFYFFLFIKHLRERKNTKYKIIYKGETKESEKYHKKSRNTVRLLFRYTGCQSEYSFIFLKEKPHTLISSTVSAFSSCVALHLINHSCDLYCSNHGKDTKLNKKTNVLVIFEIRNAFMTI